MLCSSTDKAENTYIFILRVSCKRTRWEIIMAKEKFFSAKRVTGMAVLLALVIVLQLFGGYIKIGATPLSFVLVPIVLGGILYGVGVGALLGLAFGIVVLLQGVTGVDGFTMILFQDHPIFTALLCLVKGAAAGALAGLAYKLLAKQNAYLGVFVAATVAPVTNTGLFILGSLAFLQDTLKANFIDGQTVIYFLIIGCAGINFLVELAINLVSAPSLYTVIKVVNKR